MPYIFTKEYEKAFKLLKQALISTTVVKNRDWTKPFKLMCDASDFAIWFPTFHGEWYHACDET